MGVLHQNDIIHVESLAYRDVEEDLPPHQDALYFIASLVKAFTAAAIITLVEKQKLQWDTPDHVSCQTSITPIGRSEQELDLPISYRIGVVLRQRIRCTGVL